MESKEYRNIMEAVQAYAWMERGEYTLKINKFIEDGEIVEAWETVVVLPCLTYEVCRIIEGILLSCTFDYIGETIHPDQEEV